MDGDGAAYQLVHRLRAVGYAVEGAEPDFSAKTLRGNRTPAGFVMLFTDEFHPIEPANLFLLDRCYVPARHGKWQATQAAYADDLAQWWTYLRLNGIDWRSVAAEDIKSYSTAMLEGISAKTGRPFADATVARRVGTVEELYRWAHREGYVTELPVQNGSPRPAGSMNRAMLPHVGGIKRAPKNPNRPRNPDADENVDPMLPRDLRMVLAELGASPHDPDPNNTKPTRDRLIAEVSVFTGMRVEEVVGLTSYQILDLRQHDDGDRWKPVPLRITVTKGAVPRTVALPGFLLRALLAYIDGERAAIVRAVSGRGAPAAPRRQASQALFLNGLKANDRDVGRAVSRHTAMTVFTNAVRVCGKTRMVLGYQIDPDTGLPARDAETGAEIRKEMRVVAHTFHDLRHTFAVQFYKSEIGRGNPEPWKKLQARLGHKWLSTTLNIYLKHCQTAEAELSDDFARLLKAQLDEDA